MIVLGTLNLEVYFRSIDSPAEPLAPSTALLDNPLTSSAPSKDALLASGPVSVQPLAGKLAEEVSVVQADNLQKLEGLVVLQAIRGTIHFGVPNLDKPIQVEAQLVMYVRKGAGVDSPQSLEIAIDTDLNRTTSPIKELLERALKFAEFNLTLK